MLLTTNEGRPMRCGECLLLLLAPLGLLAGAGSSARADDTVDLSGRWHGHWVSCQTGHRGVLNARFCKVNETCYRVRFTGTFFVVLPFCFTVHLQVTAQDDGKVLLAGSHQLPLFGTFHFQAVATDRQFTATYSSRKDEGQFTLCR
jgi:hypothetical protein